MFAAFIALSLALGLPSMAGGALTMRPGPGFGVAWTTTVSGTLTTDTTWTLANSPYLVQGQLVVDVGVTLTVEPGVEVRFASASQLIVRGHISAAGTAEAPIQFLGVEEKAGSWAGIELFGSGANPVSGLFENVTIAHGGGSGGRGVSLYIYSGSLEMSDSTVRDGSGDGIVAEASALSLASMQVSGNASVAVRLLGLSNAARPSFEELSISGNGTDAVSIEAAGTQSEDLHLTSLGVPYRVDGQLVIGVGTTLTVDPGVEVRFEAGAQLIVNGAIVAEGTADAPIQFLGVDETPGSWAGIEMLGGGSNTVSGTFENVTIAHGGGPGGRAGQLYVYAGSLNVSATTIRDGGAAGIVAEAAAIDLSSVEVTANAGVAVRLVGQSSVPPAAQPRLASLTIAGNGADVISVELLGTLASDAHWESLGVPYQVTGQVIVAPGVTWVIDPGVEIEFTTGSEVVVRGSLSAIGTANLPIAFRGVDRVPGSWAGIQIIGSGAAGAIGRFEHTAITDAGGAGGSRAALGVSDARATFHDGEISNAAGDGLQVAGYSPFGATRIEGSQLVDIAGTGVANSTPVLVVATNNWWGSPSGPSSADACVEGSGTSTSGLVRYAPWLGSGDAVPDPFAKSDRPVITLVPQRWYAPADGQTRIWVDLTLRDPDGIPIPGATITLSSNFGTVTSGGTTDGAGHTLAWLVATLPGDAELTAYLSDPDACDEADANEVMVTFTQTADNLLVGMQGPYMFEGIEVEPLPLTKGVESTLRATIANPNDEPLQIELEFETADFGIGLVFGPIGEAQTREIPAGGQVTFETAWVPQVTGHVCVQVLYHLVGTAGDGGAVAAIGWPPMGIGPNFAGPGSGGGQRNLNVYGAPMAGGGGGSPGGGGGKPPLDKASKMMDAVGNMGGDHIAIQTGLVGVGAGIAFNKAGTISEQLGGDPPRLDYTEVAAVESVVVDLGERPATISQAHFDAVLTLDQALADFNAVGDAATISLDRYGGASAAQDLRWASVQASSLIHYRKQLAVEAVAVADAIADLHAVFDAEGFTAESKEITEEFLGALADAEEAMRELGPYLGAEVNFPEGAGAAPTSALFGDVALAAEASELARVYDVAATFQLGNPLDHTVTVELRVRPISLPAGWPATVSPASVELAPGEQITATVVISPSGPTAQGTIARVAIEGFAEDALLGGLVVGLLVPEAVPFGEQPPTTGGVPGLPLLGIAAILAVLAVGGGAWYLRRRRATPGAGAA